MWYQLVVLLVLLAASALFSGSETAFFSLNQIEKERLSAGATGRRRSRFIASILANPAQILITILTGNMLVNFFFASLMDVAVSRYVDEYSWLYSILIGTGLVLVFGEMTPKNLAIRHSLPFFRFSSRLLIGLHSISTPIRFLLYRVERAITRLVSSTLNPEDDDSRSIISSTVQIGLQKGIVHHSELSTLESFLDFREKTAEEVMIPRTELTGVDVRVAPSSLIDISEKNSARTFIPVFKEDIDHIVGYVIVQDLLPYLYGISNAATIAPLVRPVHAVPESKNLLELLREIADINCEVALVVDEYGGTSGLVSYQDLVEDFLYVFYPSKSTYRRLGESKFRFPGNFELDRIEELLDTNFDSESRTISGFVTEKLEEIPSAGAELLVDGFSFKVRTVSRQKVLEVDVGRAQ